MVFKKGGRLRQNMRFLYNNNVLEIVDNFTYLGFVFSSGGSFSKTFDSLCGQSLKAIFKLRQYMSKFYNITLQHRL